MNNSSNDNLNKNYNKDNDGYTIYCDSPEHKNSKLKIF